MSTQALKSDPWRPLGAVPKTIVADLRLRQLVVHLHELGPRPLGEFLQELVGKDDHGVVDEIGRHRIAQPRVKVPA